MAPAKPCMARATSSRGRRSTAAADPLLREQAPHPLHHVVRGQPGLFVDQQQPVFHPPGRPAPVAAAVAAADSSADSAWPAVAGAVAPASPPIAAAAGFAGAT